MHVAGWNDNQVSAILKSCGWFVSHHKQTRVHLSKQSGISGWFNSTDKRCHTEGKWTSLFLCFSAPSFKHRQTLSDGCRTPDPVHRLSERLEVSGFLTMEICYVQLITWSRLDRKHTRGSSLDTGHIHRHNEARPPERTGDWWQGERDRWDPMEMVCFQR